MGTTEAEAREKWCPHVRGARIESLDVVGQQFKGQFQIVAGCNTDTLGRTRVPASCRCIASDCMQWRWHDGESVAPDTRRGFCGIAGPDGS